MKKRCGHCKKEKEISEFAKDKNRTDGLYPTCRDCTKEYRITNKERIASHSKEYYETHYASIALNKIQYRKNNQEKITAYQNKYREEHAKQLEEYRRGYRERIRELQLLEKYRIDSADYELMLKSQGGKCAICGGDPDRKIKNFCVDHNHETGVVRGLLCHKCNTLLGLTKDNANILRSAIAYLESEKSHDNPNPNPEPSAP